jgi:hypothetical protein
MGRGIRKLVSLFENLSSILDEADQRIIEEDVSAAEGVEPTEDAEDIKRAYVNLLLLIVCQSSHTLLGVIVPSHHINCSSALFLG